MSVMRSISARRERRGLQSHDSCCCKERRTVKKLEKDDGWRGVETTMWVGRGLG